MRSTAKIKKKNIPKSVKEMSKDMLQEALKKKKECNAKALQTVEKLCEDNIDEEWFLNNLQYINQCHFDDATVERAISKICGYPLCDKKLDKIPTQQYRISTRCNKVIDITERKNFCSDCCYKSAMYVKKQLFTSPLWFRDQEVIPQYTVLQSAKSSVGEEIVFFPYEIKQHKKATLEEKNSLEDEINKLTVKCADLAMDGSIKEAPLSQIIENNNACDNESSEKIYVVEKENKEIPKVVIKGKIDSPINIQNIPDETLDKRKLCASETETRISEEPVNVKVEKCIFEWFSIDTLFYLYTEEKLKELFQDKAVKMKEILNSELSIMRHTENIDRIIQLYGLFDSTVFSGNETKTDLKPLPDYSILKKEGENLEIKVRAFYQGQLEIKSFEKERKKEEEIETDSNPIYLPLIDAHAQKALRNKIVLDKLNRVLPQLIHAFDSDYVLQMSEVRNLTSTFILSAHNITFKPREWYFVGVIIIKLLSIKDNQLEKILKLTSAKSQLCLVLSNYNLQEDYLDNLILRLTDGSKLIEKLRDE